MNTKRLMKKLQTAIIHTGYIVKIDTVQFYSEEQGRMITKYLIKDRREKKKKDGTIVIKDFVIFESCSQIECVKFLAEVLKKERGG